MKKILFVFAILLSAKSFGQNIYVEGLLDCGKWLDARKQGTASALEHYAIGTVNGLSLGSGYEIWMGDGNRTTRTQLFYWIDAYCTKSPLDNVVSALMQFADQKTFGTWRGERKRNKMPKLDGTHIAERLKGRLEELEQGKEVAARDLRALLNEEQEAAMDAAWAEQQELRKKKRARNKEEEAALGWKSKRDLHIEALKSALSNAQDAEVAAWEKRLHDAEVRQGRVFFDELSKQVKDGVDMQTAKTRANNALTRAGLRRLDGQLIGTQGLTPRDREIRAMEDAILQKAESEMDDYEREQLELLREHEKAVAEKMKKR